VIPWQEGELRQYVFVLERTIDDIRAEMVACASGDQTFYQTVSTVSSLVERPRYERPAWLERVVQCPVQTDHRAAAQPVGATNDAGTN
jgi:hypothetical protein